MVFDMVLSAGRMPQYAGVKESFTTALAGGWSPLTITGTVALNSPRLAFALSVSMSGRDTSGYPGTAVAPVVRIFINDELIARYTLPGDSRDESAWSIDEILPVNRELWGSGNNLTVIGTCTSVSPDYSINSSFTLHTVRI